MSTRSGRLAASSLISLALACQPTNGAEPDISLANEDEKTIYAIGLALARNLSPLDLSERELGYLELGMRDGVLDREPRVEIGEYQGRIRELQATRMAKNSEVEKQASAAFLDQEAAKPGAVRTDSGLVFIEQQPGEGDHPEPSDTVKVHYHGTLRDGTVFDSSVNRGAPFVTPLSGVIPCWTEGVQRMRPGGKARLVCPSELAYRDRGAPPYIKPGAAIAFDVELIEIVK
ncbi:MAG: FKBP-type peptidyl-prolyl cis-trans isomerase [Myxococcota bacterium]